MICFDKGIFTSDQFKKVFLNGNWCNINEAEYPEVWAEVEAYLKGRPEALIPEPVPPAPTQEELDAREIQTLTSYLASTDWIIAKIGEGQMKGGDITALVGKYSNELQARGDARERINELEGA